MLIKQFTSVYFLVGSSTGNMGEMQQMPHKFVNYDIQEISWCAMATTLVTWSHKEVLGLLRSVSVVYVDINF